MLKDATQFLKDFYGTLQCRDHNLQCYVLDLSYFQTGAATAATGGGGGWGIIDRRPLRLEFWFFSKIDQGWAEFFFFFFRVPP